MYTHIYTYTYIHIHTHTVVLRTNVTKNAFGTLPEHNWNAFESRSCCYCDHIVHRVMRMLLFISHERIKQPGFLGRHFVTI